MTRRAALAELTGSEVRTDIQGLRAIAVLLVLAFHLWPEYLHGGFVGVDVFFVISGFLITGHLVRNPPRGPRDVASFWARRLRRLLPASLAVIAVTVLAGALLFPVTRLAPLVTDALASTFYVENWRLALSSVDYLAERTAASPLQHYWSLGVEEQFYLLWPVLIGLLVLRRGRLVAGIAAVLALSLAASVVWTWTQPAVAYFVTPTRLWELAAGGLLAVLLPSLPRLGAGVRAVAAWAGILLIALSAVLFTSSTPFPGLAALLPVGGTLLVLAADSRTGRFSPDVVLRLRPVQFVGDTSYAIYLWHFPLIVFATFQFGGDLTAVHKAVIVAVTLALAWLIRVLVEDPVRRSAWLRRPVRTFCLAAAATLVAAALTLVPTAHIGALDAQAATVRAQVVAASAGCLGAEALATAGCAVTTGPGTIPSPERAIDEFTVDYVEGCLAPSPFREVVTCEYGELEHPAYRIALVGNSHGAQWLPALQALAGDRSLSITTYLAVGCTPTSSSLVLDTPEATANCLDWGRRVVDQTAKGGYDLIVASAASVFDVTGMTGDAAYRSKIDGYSSVLSAWAGSKVLVIRDTPFPGFDIPECVAAQGAAACGGDRSAWVPPDPFVDAADSLARPGLSTVDLDNLFCSPTTCYPVIGGVLVYVDYSHFGATFGATLAPYLAPALDSALGR
ncbi:acyltransferase family protein [soil metagenome]